MPRVLMFTLVVLQSPAFAAAEKAKRWNVLLLLSDDQRMVRRGRWKLIWYPRADREQLFDLERDPHEMDDLCERPEQQATRTELRGQLKRWLREQGDPLLAEAAKP